MSPAKRLNLNNPQKIHRTSIMLTAQNTKQNTHFKFITSNKTNAKVKKTKKTNCQCMEMASMQNLIYEAEN